MKNKDVISLLEKNPESNFTLSVSDGASQAFSHHIVDVTDNGEQTTIVADLNEINFFHPLSTKRIIDLIKNTTAGLKLDDNDIIYLSDHIVKGLYKSNGIIQSREDAEIFADAITNPAEPNDALKNAQKNYENFSK